MLAMVISCLIVPMLLRIWLTIILSVLFSIPIDIDKSLSSCSFLFIFLKSSKLIVTLWISEGAYLFFLGDPSSTVTLFLPIFLIWLNKSILFLIWKLYWLNRIPLFLLASLHRATIFVMQTDSSSFLYLPFLI